MREQLIAGMAKINASLMQNFLVECLKFAKVLGKIDPVFLEEELEDEEPLNRLKGANEAAFREALKEELAASLVKV